MNATATEKCYLSWPVLQTARRKVRLTRGGCHWISFESIQACLDSGALEDAHIPYVPGVSRDDARIAYLVELLRGGVELDPLELRADVHPICPRLIKVWFFDGSHRFRAHQFVNQMHRIPILLSGSAAEALEETIPAALRYV